MEKLIIYSLAVSLFGISALATTRTQEKALSSLQGFVGTYKLVSQSIQNHPKTQTPGFCPTEISAKASLGTAENGCPDCGAGFDIFGLPEGSGAIVVQMDHVNEGRQSHLTENPMWGGVDGLQTSKSEVSGNQLSHESMFSDVFGRILYSDKFQAVLEGQVLKTQISKYNTNYTFEQSTSKCVYQKEQSN